MLKGEALGPPEPFEQYTLALQGLKSPPTKMPLHLPHSYKLFCREEEQQQVVSGALLPLVFIALHLRCHIQRVPFQSHILKTLLLSTSWGSVPLPRWPQRRGHGQPRAGTALLSPAQHIWWRHHWLMYLTATGLTQTTPQRRNTAITHHSQCQRCRAENRSDGSQCFLQWEGGIPHIPQFVSLFAQVNVL